MAAILEPFLLVVTFLMLLILMSTGIRYLYCGKNFADRDSFPAASLVGLFCIPAFLIKESTKTKFVFYEACSVMLLVLVWAKGEIAIVPRF